MQIAADAAKAALHTALGSTPGPGGVAGLVHEGKVLWAEAWGYADLEAGRRMEAGMRLPICSISKQMTCMAYLAELGAPEGQGLEALLPKFKGPRPSVASLCHNQSGLRDYWALTILLGAKAEQTFAKEDAARVFALQESGHFAQGSSYSYSNGNFRLLGDLLERASGADMASLYQRHVFDPAGMSGALLAADTRQRPDGVVGYEGAPDTGYLPAENGIYWQGDAGIAASLEDMLAYERWIDAGRDDPDHAYSRISGPQSFADGAPASYGFGLQHLKVGTFAGTGHGGALRGFRAFRLYLPEPRLSVVVMLNHHGDAHGAAHAIARAALGQQGGAASPEMIAGGAWEGAWLCERNGLLARLTPERHGVRLRYGTIPELLSPDTAGALRSAGTVITREGRALVMMRPAENATERLVPVQSPVAGRHAEIAGRYACAELGGATLEVSAEGPALYARFSGILGVGRPEIVIPAAKDIWVMQTRRSMDAPAPGDWTMIATRTAEGGISGLRLGCWLARDLQWEKL